MPLIDSVTGEVVASDVETLVALKRDADERNGALQQALARQAREVARLKGEATKAADADPMSVQVREVLEYWRDDLGHGRAQIPMDGERAKKTRARLAQGITVDQLKRALELASKDDWFVQRGFDDPKTIFKNEATPKLKLAVEGAPPMAVVRPIRPAEGRDYVPIAMPTPFERARKAMADEFGRDRCEVVFDRNGPPDYLLGRVAFVMFPCPITPHGLGLTMKLAEWSPGGSVTAACMCGHTEAELLDAIRAIELRRDRRRDEAVSRARAA